MVASKSSSSKQGADADGEEAVPKDDVEDEDVEYVDNEMLEKMDEQEELYGSGGDDSDDFKTMKDSEIGDEDQYKYMDGDIVKEFLYMDNDSVCQFQLAHQDHVYCIAQVPHGGYNTFISGDGDDKCYVWDVRPKQMVDSEDPLALMYECVKVGELEGHTETVEFIKFNHDGKYVITGGMNNVLRVW